MSNTALPISANTLRRILEKDDLCLSRNPRGTDKGDKKSYIDKYYERHFAAYRDQPIKLMEIGFRHGASLALWSEYFSKGKILGADNFSDVAVGHELPVVEQWVKRPNVEISVGDAYSEGFAKGLKDKFDIIIDDGPHTLETQQIALSLYLPKLKPNGTFVIEDILSGGLAIFPLLSRVPAGFNVYFYDFRWHRLCGDNCLFVVKPSNSRIGGYLNRISITLRGAFYFPVEGSLRLIKKLLNA